MIILASKSASRRAMLDAAGVAYESVPASLDERAVEAGMADAAPSGIAQGLAVAKAQAVASLDSDQIILGSDSLVVVDGKRFDKPADRDAAAEHLRFFSGKEMHLHSGAALVRDDEVLWQGGDLAKLHVRQLSDKFIDSYLSTEWPAVAGCVGVFRIEAMGVQLFERIEGDQFTVLGMPLLPVLGALRALGELPS
ncbi:Maf family nucleotide pyrophosphatase [Pontixanthobacter aestiaquae]|uniref:Nucleoside triphosphate pyrophosphatase n=1 Tax=Pontixanthobacter aestiaquae TaxID=1509367 RepID=A0A844Z074_9SPHN|nr:Maf family nucleotide pyrophosphatase [Pontixanthobacter aestiaquae]MDN3646887.1 Maf family nucleotide pyrophosphatase [Pontixanthobacter aestiaquae]MXO82131.1 septum formation protein Maf [Pontixanthobacter aestiaquae]